MKSIYPIVFALLLLLSVPSFGADLISENNDIDPMLQKIAEAADGFPPYFKDDKHKKEVFAQWKKSEEKLSKACAAGKEDYSCLIRLGDLYRMGHNLDLKDSFDKAVLYLKKASEDKPKTPFPHLLLGKHYTFGEKPIFGETEYMEALRLAEDNFVKAHVYWGLAHSFYFQRKFKESNLYATKFLYIDPDDKVMKLIKEKSDEAIRGVFDPKVIKME